jgi:hypothetical protein
MKMGLGPEARKLDKQAIGHPTMIAFYYFLHDDQYTTKGTHTNSKQTKTFKMGDITFFKIDKKGNLRHRCLPCDAHDDQIGAANRATMKLDNKKNGWKQTQLPNTSTHVQAWCKEDNYPLCIFFWWKPV